MTTNKIPTAPFNSCNFVISSSHPYNYPSFARDLVCEFLEMRPKDPIRTVARLYTLCQRVHNLSRTCKAAWDFRNDYFTEEMAYFRSQVIKSKETLPWRCIPSINLAANLVFGDLRYTVRLLEKDLQCPRFSTLSIDNQHYVLHSLGLVNEDVLYEYINKQPKKPILALLKTQRHLDIRILHAIARMAHSRADLQILDALQSYPQAFQPPPKHGMTWIDQRLDYDDMNDPEFLKATFSLINWYRERPELRHFLAQISAYDMDNLAELIISNKAYDLIGTIKDFIPVQGARIFIQRAVMHAEVTILNLFANQAHLFYVDDAQSRTVLTRAFVVGEGTTILDWYNAQAPELRNHLFHFLSPVLSAIEKICNNTNEITPLIGWFIKAEDPKLQQEAFQPNVMRSIARIIKNALTVPGLPALINFAKDPLGRQILLHQDEATGMNFAHYFAEECGDLFKIAASDPEICNLLTLKNKQGKTPWDILASKLFLG